MRADDESFKVFSRRAIVIGGLQIIGLCILGGRLAWLQIAQGSRYKTLSDKNRINIRMLKPTRGDIIDRFGVPLAVNVKSFQVMVIPEQTNSVEDSLKALSNFIEIDQETFDRTMEQVSRTPKFLPVMIKENLSWKEVATIEVNLTELPGLMIDRGETRNYPYGRATAHITGYIGAVSEKELKEQETPDPVLSLPGFKIGKTGIEKEYDERLRGKAGAAEVEVNVIGREVRELKRKQPEQGARVTLSIDAELQRYTQEVLARERSASGIVMDVHTGAVYALASHPSYDPNQFSGGIPHDIWNELLNDPALPLNHKAIAGQYPPGSTFKMITALAGLEKGVINASNEVYCPGFFKLGTDKFHCWKKWGHGKVNLVEALRESCDTYFYEASIDIGIEKIAEVAHRFGLGEKLNFDLSGERAGLMPDKKWKYGRYSRRWQHGETVIASIGQGYILATPLQLAVMTSRLVNGGYAVEPWITAFVGEENKTKENWPNMGIRKSHLDLIRKGMEEVVNNKKGTAYASRILEEDMEMGGKTGTAQVQRITAEQRRLGVKNEDLPWKQRHHALFVGYAPIDNPRYVASVVVEHGVGGSRAAAPIAKDLLIQAQLRDPAAMSFQPEYTGEQHLINGIIRPSAKPSASGGQGI